MAFVFYDTETTGTDWFYDQILQFAAVRANQDLEPEAEANFHSRLLPHVVPSPEAMRVNRMLPRRLTDPSLPSHYEMMRAVNDTLRGWGGSLYMGFNNFGLDERMLQSAFYRTLQRPYLTVTSGNSRSDVLRLARTVELLAPGTLRVPVGDSGFPSFALEGLARANGFNGTQSHDARNDVLATLHLARLIRDEAPSVWNDFMRFAQKSSVLAHILEEQIFGFTEFYKGRPYSWLVTRIGISASDKNNHYVFDLQFDPDDFASMSDDELVVYLDALPRPIKRLKANGCPIIFAVEDAPSGTEARHLAEDELHRRVRRLRDDPHLVQRLVAAREARAPQWPRSPYVEQQIFAEFTSDSEEFPYRAPHATEPPRSSELNAYRIEEEDVSLADMEEVTWHVDSHTPFAFDQLVHSEWVQ